MTGRDLSSSQRDGWLYGVREDDRNLTRVAWKDALHSGQAGEIECRLQGQFQHHWYRLRFLPLIGENGTIANWLCLCDDIDAQKRREEAADFLAEVSTTLASSLDYTTTLAQLARLIVARIADCCLVDLLDKSERFQQIAAAHVDPVWDSRLNALARRCHPDCAHGIGKVLASGVPEVADGSAPWSAAIACDSCEQAVLNELDVSSYMIVPLAAPGRRLGTITFIVTESRRRYTAEDLLFAQELAHRAALAVDHALMYEAAQIEIAHRARTEEALRQSQEMFSKAFAASPDAVSISRASDGRYIDVNESFLSLCGYARDEVVGATSLALGIWPDATGRARLLEALREHGHVRGYEAVFRTKLGEPIITLVSAQIIDLHGEPHILGVTRDITERKRIEESLRHNAARFKAQYKALPVSAYIWQQVGDDLILEDYNDAAVQLSGSNIASFLGKNARSVFSHEPTMLGDMERCLRERTVIRRDGLFRQLCSDDVRYFHVTFVFVTPDLVIVYSEDVTAREEAAEQLRGTLKDLADAKFAIDQSAIVSSTDADGRIIYVNDKFCETSKYTREELIGNTHRIVNSGHHPSTFFEEMRNTIKAGRVWSGEVCNRAKDGSRYWAGTTIVPLLGSDGQPTQYTAIRYDITARKLAEEHVQFQAHMLQLIGEAVIAADLNGRVLYWNRFAEKLYGWTAEEARGRNLTDFIARDGDKHRTLRFIEDVKQGHNWVAEEMLVRRDGSGFLASLNVTPLYDRSGVVTGTISVINDITERKRLEEDLIKVQKLESIGVLAGGIAHDFNNILTALLGNVTLAKLHLNEGHRSHEALTEAENGFARARDLTRQLLTFAKGGAPVRRVGSLASLLVETPRFALTGSNVRCKCSVPEDLWPVSFDAGQISQALNNLIINAKQAMPAGGRIMLTAKNLRLKTDEVPSLQEGDYVCIAIHDRGVGIPQEHLRKIFDPYFTTKQQGSGLGLATTYSIITRHEGQIAVESQLGIGTKFSIYLPAARGLELPADGEPAELVFGEGRVLLMDDEATIRRVAGRLLERLGYRVDYAVDGAEALDLYRAARDAGQPYRVVILDLTVAAGMGGEECIKRLRDIDPHVRAIVSSGYSNDPVMAQYERFGFAGVVAKPYRLNELSAALQHAIGSASF